MSRDSDIGLADLALAIDALAPEPGDYLTRASIARLLGFEWAPEIELSVTVHERRVRDEGEGAAPTTTAGIGAKNAPRRRPAPGDDSRPIRLLPIKESTRAMTTDFAWLDDYGREEVDRPPPQKPNAPPSPSLFRRNWQRGILHAATALVEPSGEVDMPTLIRLSASRRVLTRLPRRLRPTLRHGVQLLLDTSRSMAPFHQDQVQLLTELGRLFPGNRRQVFSFLEAPTRGVVSSSDRARSDYAAPERPQTVLVVSDFGAAPRRAEDRPATAEEWLVFAEQLLAAECPFVALSPYRRRDWHPELAARAEIIPWDRVTTIAHVAHARRRSRR